MRNTNHLSLIQQRTCTLISCVTHTLIATSTHLNMSIVSSENLACSQAEPTISISCRLSVMWGVLSQGGVVRGLNLEPEPLWVNTGGVTLSHSERRMARAFELSMNSGMAVYDCVCVCFWICLSYFLCV